MEDDFVALKPGQTIGRYEVISVLGQGGFGITYRARDGQLGREVAIKEYLPTALAVRQDGTTVLPRSTAACRRLRLGPRALPRRRRARWPACSARRRIVRVFDFLEANGTAYMVMELLERRDAGRAARARTARWRRQTSSASCGRCSTGSSRSMPRASSIATSSRPTSCSMPQGKPTLIDFGAVARGDGRPHRRR